MAEEPQDVGAEDVEEEEEQEESKGEPEPKAVAAAAEAGDRVALKKWGAVALWSWGERRAPSPPRCRQRCR
jgi:hypothetical protein